MMRRREIDAAVGAAYPPRLEELEELPLDAAERELIAAIVAEPQEVQVNCPGSCAEPVRSARAVNGNRFRQIRRRYGGLCAAGAVTIAAFFGVVNFGGDRGGAPAPAFGAELVRLAKASPLVLLDAPGWHVAYAAEGSKVKGVMHFFYDGSPTIGSAAGENPPAIGERSAKLRWRVGRLTERMYGRGEYPALAFIGTPLLHGRALVFHIKGHPGHFDVTATWEDHGRVLAFRSTAPDLVTFKQRLSALRRVGATAWLSALPSSGVQAVGQNAR
jgi:hypothetical protein